jgi:ADP-ribosylglycohydrolase
MADDGLSGAIHAGLVAFAAGDALGTPWEGRRPREVRGILVPGMTSDDTAQLLTAAEVLAEGTQDVARRFLQRLSEGFQEIRGSGSTSRAAVERFRRTGETVAAAGPRDAATNGALMRAPAVGYAIADPRRRRAVGLELARATHGPMAAFAAVIVADLAAWAVEARPLRHATADAADGWYLPSGGVPMSARGTLAALLRLVHDYEQARKAIPAAVRLGGDTDTIAALAGAITGPRDPLDVKRLPWLADVELPAGLDGLAQRLARARAGA